MMSLITKDIRDFGAHPFGVLSLALLIILAYLFLWIFPNSNYLSYGLAEGELYYQFLSYLLLFVVPAFSVSILSNEFKYGTEELLRSLYLDWRRIIIAKFIAAFMILGILLLLTTPHLIVIHDLAESTENLNFAQVFGSYLGLIGIGSCFVSLSLLVTSFVRQNTASYLISVFLCFLLFYGFSLLSSLPGLSGGWDYYIEKMSLSFHVEQIAKGILSLTTMAYIIGIVAWSLWVASFRLSTQEV